MERICSCGRPVPPQTGPGKPRTKCEVCSPSRAKGAPPRPGRPAPVAALPERELPPGCAGLVAETRAALLAVGKLDSPAGALAILQAGMLEDGGHTASGVAALAKQLLATMALAVGDAPVAADRLDELAARRAGKTGT